MFQESKEGLHPGYIALIAVLATLLLVVVVLLLLWKLHVIPKTKTHGMLLLLSQGGLCMSWSPDFNLKFSIFGKKTILNHLRKSPH